MILLKITLKNKINKQKKKAWGIESSSIIFKSGKIYIFSIFVYMKNSFRWQYLNTNKNYIRFYMNVNIQAVDDKNACIIKFK